MRVSVSNPCARAGTERLVSTTHKHAHMHSRTHARGRPRGLDNAERARGPRRGADSGERPPRARPFEHRAQGPMGCVRVGSLARRGERAAAAGRRLGSSSAHTGGSPWRSDAATRRRRYQVPSTMTSQVQVLYHGTMDRGAEVQVSRRALCEKM